MTSELNSDPNSGCVGLFVLALLLLVTMTKGCETNTEVQRLRESSERIEHQLKENSEELDRLRLIEQQLRENTQELRRRK